MSSLVHFKTRPAFTLIEMMIVIMIVGIIAALAVSSYGSIRKQAKLDIAVDSLITAFKEQGSKAKSGQHQGAVQSTLSEETQNLEFSCFGLHFEKNKPFVQYAIAPYIRANTDKADVCDHPQQVLAPYDFLEEVELKDITVHEVTADQLDVFFKPPFGKAVASIDGTTFEPFSKIILTVGLKNSEEKRLLEVDGLTGSAQRIKNTPS